MPQGSVNITGILLRYNNQWEVVVRTLNDIKRIINSINTYNYEKDSKCFILDAAYSVHI